MMYITLAEWDAETFSQTHHISTLRAWAKSGQIYPEPIKVGRQIMVERGARFVPLRPTYGGLSDKLLADSRVSRIFFEGSQAAQSKK